jgi:hypothetical protein
MFPMRPTIFLFALFAVCGAANAEDNPACAKFENALAYNACLAKLGPKAYAAAPTRERYGGRREKSGRVKAEFSVRGRD